MVGAGEAKGVVEPSEPSAKGVLDLDRLRRFERFFR